MEVNRLRASQSSSQVVEALYLGVPASYMLYVRLSVSNIASAPIYIKCNSLRYILNVSYKTTSL
jgi:hypothetical protein